jgi:hypothetical protein
MSVISPLYLSLIVSQAHRCAPLQKLSNLLRDAIVANVAGVCSAASARTPSHSSALLAPMETMSMPHYQQEDSA